MALSNPFRHVHVKPCNLQVGQDFLVLMQIAKENYKKDDLESTSVSWGQSKLTRTEWGQYKKGQFCCKKGQLAITEIPPYKPESENRLFFCVNVRIGGHPCSWWNESSRRCQDVSLLSPHCFRCCHVHWSAARFHDFDLNMDSEPLFFS